MAVPVVTPLPIPPNRTSGAGEFAPRADIFYAAMPQFQTDMNTLATFTNQRAVDADQSATDSAGSASESAGSAAAAYTHMQAAQQAATDSAAYRDASQLAAGQSADSATASAGSADAAAGSAIAANAERIAAEAAKDDAITARDDAEYWAGQAQETVTGGIINDTSLLATRVRSALDTSRGNFAAVAVAADATIGVLDFAQITATGIAVTVTLPATPEPGQMVMVGNLTDRRDHRIAVGTAPVKGQDAGGYIVIDKPYFTITLKFVSAGYGWELL